MGVSLDATGGSKSNIIGETKPIMHGNSIINVLGSIVTRVELVFCAINLKILLLQKQ